MDFRISVLCRARHRHAILGALFALVWILSSVSGLVDLEAKPIQPYEKWGKFSTELPIDQCVFEELQHAGIKPAFPCSDAVFVRRVFLDLTGVLPKTGEIMAFQRNKNPNKRAALIDQLMERDSFTDFWTLKWCDLLRVKAEYPINLWPNGVQAYHRWIFESVRENKPYDVFARELLTSSGSNFRVPPVNFYRAMQGTEPSEIARMVGLTFMGVRLENWKDQDRVNLAGFFSKVGFKKTAEWKEEIVSLEPSKYGQLKAVFPDGNKVTIPADQDPRKVFADWLITPDNRWFTRNIANRVWSWFMGRGIIHEPDDIREDNPPSNSELLAYLEQELIEADYDLKHLFRLILNSATYQQSSIPQSDHPDATSLFAHYPIRRLKAEVLVDTLAWLGGKGEVYTSPIPEPFTFIPEYHHSMELADGSITSQPLIMFGRASRDTGLEMERDHMPTDAQRLFLLNSSDVHNKLATSPVLRRIYQQSRNKPNALIRTLYLTLLSRGPTEEEIKIAFGHLKASGLKNKQGSIDLAWALINTKEFLYAH